jgi:hypothetical protein
MPEYSDLAGHSLYFSYYLDGGSVYGVTPVADSTNLQYMGISSANCNLAHECDYSSAYMRPPIVGFSDVDESLFEGSNIRGLSFGSPENEGKLTAEQHYAQVFGVAMNLSLLDGSVYPGGTGSIKSLSRSSIATILSGKKAQWEAIAEFGSMERWVNGIDPFSDIDICRRLPGSGAQAAAQIYFLGEGCGDTALTFITAASDSTRVRELPSSQELLYCVNTLPNAIGFSSLVKQPGPTYGSNWAYVAIDGIMPTTENAAMGVYDFMFESSIQYHSDVEGKELSLIKALIDFAGNSLCDSLTAGNECTAPKEGVLYLSNEVNRIPGDWTDNDGDLILAEYNTINDVAWSTRGFTAWDSTPSLSCKLPTQVFP